MPTPRDDDPSPLFADLSRFARPDLAQWRQAAEAALGRPLRPRRDAPDGPTRAPLYVADDAPAPRPDPGQPPFTRGALAPAERPEGGWFICQRVDHPDPARAAHHAHADLSAGVEAVWLVVDPDLERGAGVAVASLPDLERVLEHVALDRTPLLLDAGAAALPAAAALLAVARRRGVPTEALRGSLGADPLAFLAQHGHLPGGLARCWRQLAALTRWTARHAPRLRPLLISEAPYREAGASPARALALLICAGLEHLRALTDAGLDVDAACRALMFSTRVGVDGFTEVARLRALRALWARVAAACGASPDASRALLHAAVARRVEAARDPWVNLLRATHAAFAAIVGGAQYVSTPPLDRPLDRDSDLGRRMARNTQLILREESHLGRALDPAGGSHLVERLTDDLMAAAWPTVQAIEGAGGLARALSIGRVAALITEDAAAHAARVATRRAPITGVSDFPLLDPRPVEGEPIARAAALASAHERARQAPDPDGLGADPHRAADADLVARAIDALTRGASLPALARALAGPLPDAAAPALPAGRDARPFERLRDAADAWRDAHGQRPRAFLANLGPLPQHRARAGFAAPLLRAGGLEVVDNDGFDAPDAAAEAFAQSDARVAVICSSDAAYPTAVPPLARALKAHGARLVLVAGAPGAHEDAWRQAGVDAFMHLGCDALAVLRQVHAALDLPAADP